MWLLTAGQMMELMSREQYVMGLWDWRIHSVDDGHVPRTRNLGGGIPRADDGRQHVAVQQMRLVGLATERASWLVRVLGGTLTPDHKL